jgi:hypothetical protein
MSGVRISLPPRSYFFFLFAPFWEDLEPACFGFFFSLRWELFPFAIVLLLIFYLKFFLNVQNKRVIYKACNRLLKSFDKKDIKCE